MHICFHFCNNLYNLGFKNTMTSNNSLTKHTWPIGELNQDDWPFRAHFLIFSLSSFSVVTNTSFINEYNGQFKCNVIETLI